METRDHTEQLLDYCSSKLPPQATAILERHIDGCPACQEFVARQRAVLEALDRWEASPVSADFDRRLYARIDNDAPWWHALLRPLTVRWNVVASAAGVFVLLGAGLLLNRPAAVKPAKPDTAQVQPEQVERALDAMDMLAEFDSHVKSPGAKM
jgi:anti-sigma factor RsiW